MADSTKMNYIELPCMDFAKAQYFYEAAFGWTFVPYGEDYLAFNDSAMDGGFYKAQMQCRQENGSALVVLYSPTLEAIRDKVVSCGGQIHKDIFSFPGGRRFHFLDPHGNELAIWSDN
ncbi:VOC family protein [Polycladidibacter stylochi]|uniref:VOC family protein n=1 Tax=Polycladidibacter stylochi TaxID=1807766 RepID=UPI00082DFADE|nr:VOC family protein [Pseudovibrio stylochi]